jgi:hypothetical protein
MASALLLILPCNANTQTCNGIPIAIIPMMAKMSELRHESNRLPLAAIRLDVSHGEFHGRVATIASARTIGEVHDVDRYWGDRVVDSPHSPV